MGNCFSEPLTLINERNSVIEEGSTGGHSGTFLSQGSSSSNVSNSSSTTTVTSYEATPLVKKRVVQESYCVGHATDILVSSSSSNSNSNNNNSSNRINVGDVGTGRQCQLCSVRGLPASHVLCEKCSNSSHLCCVCGRRLKSDILLGEIQEALKEINNSVNDRNNSVSSIYKALSEELKIQKEVIRRAVEMDPSGVLPLLPKGVQLDKEVALIAVRKDGSLLRYCGEEQPIEVLKAAVAGGGFDHLQFASPMVLRNRLSMLELVKVDGRCLKWASFTMRSTDEEVILAALENDGRAMEFLPSGYEQRLKNNAKIMNLIEKQKLSTNSSSSITTTTTATGTAAAAATEKEVSSNILEHHQNHNNNISGSLTTATTTTTKEDVVVKPVSTNTTSDGTSKKAVNEVSNGDIDRERSADVEEREVSSIQHGEDGEILQTMVTDTSSAVVEKLQKEEGDNGASLQPESIITATLITNKEQEEEEEEEEATSSTTVIPVVAHHDTLTTPTIITTTTTATTTASSSNNNNNNIVPDDHGEDEHLQDEDFAAADLAESDSTTAVVNMQQQQKIPKSNNKKNKKKKK